MLMHWINISQDGGQEWERMVSWFGDYREEEEEEAPSPPISCFRILLYRSDNQGHH
ncbi:hypothetical protein ES332_A01G198700v1 [Gossypium tomentosum]|uniref:Uncharacterized protein n=1 Tax=Gossypium tomentosum TaxID=34277 RepID=A0A5D2RV29_GOSTO|nr:hypothetical protein ES332_A01G198700v1 [Gossypium tomentosum]